MTYVALTFSIAIAVVGAIGIFLPTPLLVVSRPFLTPIGLYLAGAIRVVFGVALILAATRSRAPNTLRVVGVILVIAGVVTPLVGVDRARAIVEWWTAQGTALIRVWGGVALALGVFLTYAVGLRTPRSDRP